MSGHGVGPTTAERLSQALASDVARLYEQDPAVRLGEDPEAVHQARVATRRMRALLRSFGPVLRQKALGGLDDLGADLRRLGRLLGRVRDLDVLTERLGADAAGLDPAGCAPVLARLGVERQDAFADLLVEMRSGRYAALRDRLAGLPEAELARRRVATRPAAAVLVPLVRREWARLEAAVAELGPAPEDTALHHVRILSKQVRYAAEATAEDGPEGLAFLAKRSARIQKVLGELNDASRATSWLEGLKSSPWPADLLPESGGDPLVTVEELLARQHLALSKERTRWRETYERAAKAAAHLGWSAAQAPPGSDGRPGGAGSPASRLEAVRP